MRSPAGKGARCAVDFDGLWAGGNDEVPVYSVNFLVLVLAWVCFRWHPRCVIWLHASPLCGAAPTFLCRRKEK
ncbi:hypothetical protein BCAR13_870031 [Paraburkholderia caribensis]|nr:hypothetical protein BCAR13_870031 [Paraburkholderia caribensis]